MPFVDLDKSDKVPISWATLVKLSGAGVDPYTRYVAYHLFGELKLPVKGQRNVNNALANLPIYMSVAPDDTLGFGWGLSNVIRDRFVHNAAYEHLAVIIALSEGFHDSYAAKVLKELTHASAEIEDLRPHLRQWKAAVHACNGVFAATDFGLLVEEYVRLNPYNITRHKHPEANFPPETVANTLQSLMKVVQGQEKQITITGSAIISWFAALAEWLCDMKVEVYQANGKRLHATHHDEEPHVVLCFVQAPCIQHSFDPWQHEVANVANLNLKERTYPASVHATPFGGRVAWESLLPRVFGRSFHFLDHENSKALGGMIGSAAKMFEGFAHGEGRERYSELVSPQNQGNAASHGAGLVETITNWMPELRRFQGRMERALKLDHDDAATAFVENLSQIRQACHCGICTSKDEVDKEKEGFPPDHGYCLAVIMETIISLGLMLSRMTVSPRIFPSRAGIQSFYAGQVQKRMEARGLHWSEHFRLVYGNEWNAPDSRRLQNAIEIFSGSRPVKDLPPNLVAISHEGMCAYFVALEKPLSFEGAKQGNLIRVVSGGISVREKVFDRACLGPVDDDNPEESWEELRYEHLPKPLFCK